VAADEPADAVTGHRGHDRDHGHDREVQAARTRVDRGGDQHRFTGDRDAEVFQQQQAAHRGVSVSAQVRRDGREQAG
jgi:hypothetical protein